MTKITKIKIRSKNDSSVNKNVQIKTVFINVDPAIKDEENRRVSLNMEGCKINILKKEI